MQMANTDDHERQNTELEARGRYVASVGGGALAQALLLVEANPAAAALAGAALSPMLTNLFGKLVERRHARLQAAIDAACLQGNCIFDDIIRASLPHDKKLELLAAALNGAALAIDERKVRALGNSIALGVLQDDEAVVDEQVRIAEGLIALDAADAKVLLLFIVGDKSSFSVRPGPDARRFGNTLVERLPEAQNVIDAIVARLSSLGMISDETFGLTTNTVWHATDFGRACVEALIQAGQDRDEPLSS